jgi:cytochrome P450
MGTPFLKHHGFYQLFGLDSSVFGVINPEQHKQKRSALNPSFSRRQILELEPLIQAKVNRLCQRLQEYAGKGEPANMHNAYQALTIDTVTDFAYATSYEYVPQVK